MGQHLRKHPKKAGGETSPATRKLPNPLTAVSLTGTSAGRIEDIYDQQPAEADLLKRALPGVKERIPSGAELVSVGPSPGRAERLACRQLGPTVSALHYVSSTASGTHRLPVGRQSAETPLRVNPGLVTDLPWLTDRWQRPLVLAVFHNLIFHLPPWRMFPLVSTIVGSGDRLFFTARLWPGPDDQVAPRPPDVPPKDAAPVRALTQCGLDTDESRITCHLDRITTERGPIYRSRYVISVDTKQEVHVGDEPIRLSPGETLSVPGDYRLQGYQVERYLWSNDLQIEELWTQEAGNTAAFLVGTASQASPLSRRRPTCSREHEPTGELKRDADRDS